MLNWLQSSEGCCVSTPDARPQPLDYCARFSFNLFSAFVLPSCLVNVTQGSPIETISCPLVTQSACCPRVYNVCKPRRPGDSLCVLPTVCTTIEHNVICYRLGTTAAPDVQARAGSPCKLPAGSLHALSGGTSASCLQIICQAN